MFCSLSIGVCSQISYTMCIILCTGKPFYYRIQIIITPDSNLPPKKIKTAKGFFHSISFHLDFGTFYLLPFFCGIFFYCLSACFLFPMMTETVYSFGKLFPSFSTRKRRYTQFSANGTHRNCIAFKIRIGSTVCVCVCARYNRCIINVRLHPIPQRILKWSSYVHFHCTALFGTAFAHINQCRCCCCFWFQLKAAVSFSRSISLYLSVNLPFSRSLLRSSWTAEKSLNLIAVKDAERDKSETWWRCMCKNEYGDKHTHTHTYMWAKI